MVLSDESRCSRAVTLSVDTWERLRSLSVPWWARKATRFMNVMPGENGMDMTQSI
jgi:hypothetical protein